MQIVLKSIKTMWRTSLHLSQQNSCPPSPHLHCCWHVQLDMACSHM